MVVHKKVVKVKVQAELEDGVVSHFELPENSVLFIDLNGVLQMGHIRSIVEDVCTASLTVRTIEASHVPIHTTGYSGAANNLPPGEMAVRCKCGHSRGEHMSNAPHACAQGHCEAFDPVLEEPKPMPVPLTNNRKDEAEW